MKQFIPIQSIYAREILDSRGNPTVEAEVITEGGFLGRASVPSGASVGTFEAAEKRDGNPKRYGGKGCRGAVDNVNNIIAPLLKGVNVLDQQEADRLLIKRDGTKNKEKLGANAMLGVSLAVAKAGAEALGLSLFQYLGGTAGKTLPVPMMNILNGGKHADNNLSIQEFMIMPVGAGSFAEALRWGAEIYHELKKCLKEKGLSTTGRGDEGGFAPDLGSDEEALALIVNAVERSGYTPGRDVELAIDAAAGSMYEEAVKAGHSEGYHMWKSSQWKTADEMIEYWERLCSTYPVTSIEDGLGEEDWIHWQQLTQRIGGRVCMVGDDLFVTNTERLRKGIMLNAANGILIKPNQIGTISETFETINLARNAGYTTVISHRSGETEDTSIADIAVAMNCGRIKTGAPSGSERTAKYNRLLRIEEELDENGIYGM